MCILPGLSKGMHSNFTYSHSGHSAFHPRRANGFLPPPEKKKYIYISYIDIPSLKYSSDLWNHLTNTAPSHQFSPQDFLKQVSRCKALSKDGWRKTGPNALVFILAWPDLDHSSSAKRPRISFKSLCSIFPVHRRSTGGKGFSQLLRPDE